MLQICVCGDGNFVIVLNNYCKQVRINLFPEIFFLWMILLSKQIAFTEKPFSHHYLNMMD